MRSLGWLSAKEAERDSGASAGDLDEHTVAFVLAGIRAASPEPRRDRDRGRRRRSR